MEANTRGSEEIKWPPEGIGKDNIWILNIVSSFKNLK